MTRSGVVWLCVYICLVARAWCAAPPCDQNVSSVVGTSAVVVDEERQLIPLGIDERVDQLIKYDVLGKLAEKDVRAVFFFGAQDMYENERFLRRLVAAGHHIGLNLFRRQSDGLGRYEMEIIRSISAEQGFVESVTGKKPILVLAPEGPNREPLLNATRAMGTFLLEWKPVPLTEIPTVLTEKQPESLEAFMNSEQVHCAFDRTSCDFVGRWEIYREQCRQFRIAFYAREGVDLFKFVLRDKKRHVEGARGNREPSEMIQRDVALESTESFIERNRYRVEKAYEKVDSGAHLREVMLILFSLSDQQIANTLDQTLAYETRDYRATTVITVASLASMTFVLYIFLVIRAWVERGSVLPRAGASQNGPFFSALAEMSKAE